MARNEPFEMTADQRACATWAREALAPFTREDSAPVTIGYTKRDGTASTLTGKATGIVGAESTEAVTVETAKGFRSANLWAIASVSN